MQARKYTFAATIIGLLILATACTGISSENRSVDENVETFDQLVDELRTNGMVVESVGTVSQPFFSPEGQVISIDSQEVQVFEFTTVNDAESAAETISPNGSSIGTSMVAWVSTPHFYSTGKFVVLYVGEEESVISVLEDVLGPQIAGR